MIRALHYFKINKLYCFIWTDQKEETKLAQELNLEEHHKPILSFDYKWGHVSGCTVKQCTVELGKYTHPAQVLQVLSHLVLCH